MSVEPSRGGCPWSVRSGSIAPEDIAGAATEVAGGFGLTVDRSPDGGELHLRREGVAAVHVRWQPAPPSPRGPMAAQGEPPRGLHVVVSCEHPDFVAVAERLIAAVDARIQAFDADELARTVASMPLVREFSAPDGALADWALVFRDHYLEHSLGFVLGMERAGIPAAWIFALAKGDRTRGRERIHATFLARGYRSGVFDNADIDGPGGPFPERTAAIEAELDAFVDAAHADGRRVLAVDDGGLVALGYGRLGADRQVDAAVELTVSGLKRIAKAGPLAVPVVNMARSAVKTHLGYGEIADSCLRRLRDILPASKLIGRPVVVLGFGTLGSRLARALRGLGCPVTVVDPDVLALIVAAEDGFATHRSLGDALRATRPFVIAGTTGEVALGADDVPLLPDGVHLAPFATRDFSRLVDPATAPPSTEIPGLGRRFTLVDGRRVTLLGDGRSLNLFEADSIPNGGYDAYRAGTLIAAKALCSAVVPLSPRIHTSFADAAIGDSGLLDRYYRRYLGAPETATPEPPRPPAPPPSTGRGPHRSAAPVGLDPVAWPLAGPSRPTPSLGPRGVVATRPFSGLRVCVVGYGVAGRLHRELLTDLGAHASVVDPMLEPGPGDSGWLPGDIRDLPDDVAARIDVWSICCPTDLHLDVLRAVLERTPAARVLVEKPACRGDQIDELEALLVAHPRARVVINDHYRNAAALPMLGALAAELEPGRGIDELAVAFTKDRAADIARGRFVDRGYGVLGYEWLHMLAVLRELAPGDAIDAYLRGDVRRSRLCVTYHQQLFVSALSEHVAIPVGPSRTLRASLSSSIVGTSLELGDAPRSLADWGRELRPSDDRTRQVTLAVGSTRLMLHLDPVTTGGGWQLQRNHHRLSATRGDHLVHDEIIADSPLRNGLVRGVELLVDDRLLPPPDLLPLRRIAALARHLRDQQSGQREPVSLAGAD